MPFCIACPWMSCILRMQQAQRRDWQWNHCPEPYSTGMATVGAGICAGCRRRGGSARQCCGHPQAASPAGTRLWLWGSSGLAQASGVMWALSGWGICSPCPHPKGCHSLPSSPCAVEDKFPALHASSFPSFSFILKISLILMGGKRIFKVGRWQPNQDEGSIAQSLSSSRISSGA